MEEKGTIFNTQPLKGCQNGWTNYFIWFWLGKGKNKMINGEKKPRFVFKQFFVVIIAELSPPSF
jgi:hypothetical protein